MMFYLLLHCKFPVNFRLICENKMRNLKYGIQIGKTQPIPKLDRFIPKLSGNASVH